VSLSFSCGHGRTVEWILDKRTSLVEHIQTKCPIQAPSNAWWAARAALSPLFQACNIVMKKLQSPSIVISQQRDEVRMLILNLSDGLGSEWPNPILRSRLFRPVTTIKTAFLDAFIFYRWSYCWSGKLTLTAIHNPKCPIWHICLFRDPGLVIWSLHCQSRNSKQWIEWN